MGGRPCLCSVIQSTPWQAVCRGCVCSAIVACTEIIPAFVAPLHNLPPPQRKMLTLSFAHFPAHSRLHSAVSTETGSGGRELSPTHSSSFSKSNTSFLHSTQAHRSTIFPLQIASIVLKLLCVVQWNKKGNCLYFGTMESLSAAAELTHNGSSVLLKIIVLDHKLLCTDQSTCKFILQI